MTYCTFIDEALPRGYIALFRKPPQGAMRCWNHKPSHHQSSGPVTVVSRHFKAAGVTYTIENKYGCRWPATSDVLM